MSTIPTYQLRAFTEPSGQPAEVFFLGPQSEPPTLRIDQPYRSSYYKIGLCLRGSAQLRVNLETYELGPGSLMLLSPHVIKQWTDMSADHESLSIFFTREFITSPGGPDLDRFGFFDLNARHVFTLAPEPAQAVGALLSSIGAKFVAPHPYRAEILRSLIHILLHETAAIYQQQPAPAPGLLNRAQLIAADFKKLVSTHYAIQRGLAFYADQLCITPKHLAETVREATGQRAAEWIAAAVLLEARVLLQNPALSVAQVAELLHFSDQSAFGRFFRNGAGLSPAAYRQRHVARTL